MKHIYSRLLNLQSQRSILSRTVLLFSGLSAGAYLFYKNMAYFKQCYPMMSPAPLCEAAPGKQLFNPYTRSKQCEPLLNADTAVIVGGSSNRDLNAQVAKFLGMPALADSEVRRFADGETSIRIKENLNGKHVYIVQPTCPPVNDSLMELILTISAAKRAGAASVICVIPYYGYARQDRKFQAQNTPISGADAAQILEFMGADRLISVDLHVSQA
jgi:ribose-phosphate pyrophosphokinase